MKWQKGQSGNPAGRPPKGGSVAELLRARLDKPRFVDALLKLCYRSDIRALALVLAYTEGLPARQNEVRVLAGMKIEVHYVDRHEQHNSIAVAGAAPIAEPDHQGGEEVQRGLLREALGQIDVGDGQDHQAGVERTADSLVCSDVPDADGCVERVLDDPSIGDPRRKSAGAENRAIERRSD